MPIYEYQCGACGQLQEFLQKLSEAPRKTCVHCGQEALTKRVTAAGFQLKGSGWYVTDFRNGGSKPDAKPSSGSGTAEGKAAAAEGAAAAAPSPAAPSPAASPAPAAASPAGASPASGA